MSEERRIEETEKYFSLIKTRLKNKKNQHNLKETELSISDFVFTVPYDFDDEYLRELCESEKIRMWYTSTNDRAGMINYCPLHDVINFSQRTIDIIIDNDIQLVRRMK